MQHIGREVNGDPLDIRGYGLTDYWCEEMERIRKRMRKRKKRRVL